MRSQNCLYSSGSLNVSCKKAGHYSAPPEDLPADKILKKYIFLMILQVAGFF